MIVFKLRPNIFILHKINLQVFKHIYVFIFLNFAVNFYIGNALRELLFNISKRYLSNLHNFTKKEVKMSHISRAKQLHIYLYTNTYKFTYLCTHIYIYI